MVLDQEEVLHSDGSGDGSGRASSAAHVPLLMAGTGSGADLLWAALLCCCLGLKDGLSQAEPGAQSWDFSLLGFCSFGKEVWPRLRFWG